MEESPRYMPDSYIPFTSNERVCNNRPRFPKFNERCAKENDQEDRIDLVPWKKSNYSYGVIGLHEEINEFYDWMSPTDQETEIRLRVVEHITKTVHSLWPEAKLEVFGSFRTGLFLPTSDIDLVAIGEWQNLPLYTLSEALQKNGINGSDITVLPHASVPIIRLMHSPSRIKVDISFNMKNGVQTAKAIKGYMKAYPALSKLVVVLKQFLVHRNMNEVYNGGMSSYCLTLLIVSFLQGHHKPKCLPSSNLGTLLIEFFELYGINFNYENVSIHFNNGGSYKPKIGFGQSLLSVEDPLVEGNDIAKGTFLMYQIKAAFENAFSVLNKAVINSQVNKRKYYSYLNKILNVDKQDIDGRMWLMNNYSNILRSLSVPEIAKQCDNYVQNSKKFGKTSRVGFKRLHPTDEHQNNKLKEKQNISNRKKSKENKKYL